MTAAAKIAVVLLPVLVGVVVLVWLAPATDWLETALIAAVALIVVGGYRSRFPEGWPSSTGSPVDEGGDRHRRNIGPVFLGVGLVMLIVLGVAAVVS